MQQCVHVSPASLCLPAYLAGWPGWSAGAYAAIECVGDELFAQVAAAVRNHGTIYIYGAMSGLTVRIPCLLTCAAANGTARESSWLLVCALSSSQLQTCAREKVGRIALSMYPASPSNALAAYTLQATFSIPDPLFRGVVIKVGDGKGQQCFRARHPEVVVAWALG